MNVVRQDWRQIGRDSKRPFANKFRAALLNRVPWNHSVPQVHCFYNETGKYIFIKFEYRICILDLLYAYLALGAYST